MEQRQEASALAALAGRGHPDTTKNTEPVAFNSRIAFIIACIRNAETALSDAVKVEYADALRVETEIKTTPKRRKFDVSQHEHDTKNNDANPNENLLQHEGAQLFSEAIQNRAQEVDCYIKIGGVPCQLMPDDGFIFEMFGLMFRLEVSQPGSKVRMHLIAREELANRWHQELRAREHSVVRLGKAQYEYSPEYNQHQLKITDKTTVKEVKDKTILDAFEDSGLNAAMPAAERPPTRCGNFHIAMSYRMYVLPTTFSIE